MNKKVYIVGNGFAYKMMFEDRGWEVVNKMEDADLVQFLGGSDVSPHLYGEAKHRFTHSDAQRDELEIKIFSKALDMKLPIAGICRGAQFVHVMNGGGLWQDVDGHAIAQGHEATCKLSGETVVVSSTHHQMMKGNVGEIILEAVNTNHTYKEGMEEGDVHTRIGGYDTEVEAVYHKKSNSLSFQPHPEMCRKESGCQELYFKYLKELLGV
jgi:putative glutamine amidotransferase